MGGEKNGAQEAVGRDSRFLEWCMYEGPPVSTARKLTELDLV